MTFVIHTHMKNGDTWKSVRRSKEDLDEFIACIWEDKEVVRFTVEERGGE